MDPLPTYIPPLEEYNKKCRAHNHMLEQTKEALLKSLNRIKPPRSLLSRVLTEIGSFVLSLVAYDDVNNLNPPIIS